MSNASGNPTWQNGQGGSTPIDANALNAIEATLNALLAAVIAAQSTASSAAVSGDGASAGANATAAVLKQWTASGAYQLTAVTYANGTYPTVPTSAVVVWPDGSAGAFVTDSINAAFFAIDAYHITHTASGKTITQTAITRNSDGNRTVVPQLTVA